MESDHVSQKTKKSKKKYLEALVSKAKKRKSEINPQEVTADENENSGLTSFTVIGRQVPPKSSKVKQYLPDWIAHPISITTDLKSSKKPIESLKDLDKSLIENLNINGITHFFPVQFEVIPWLLNDIKRCGLNFTTVHRPRDICVSAPTGSGKTLAYVLPIVQCLSKRVVPKIRALVVAPVQELVIQITSVFKQYCVGTNLRVHCSAGGRMPVHLEQEKLIKKTNCISDDSESLIDILVITPGRLVEHLENTEGFDLRYLRYLVLDEADRMLDNVQNEWLYHLEKHLSSGGLRDSLVPVNVALEKNLIPQRLLFSATLSQDPEKLKKSSLFQPVLFATVTNEPSELHLDETEDYIGSITTPSELKEYYIIAENVLKPLVICELIRRGWRRVLCFTKSALDAHKLSKLLSIMNPTLKITEISSLLTTEQRSTILNDFSSGSVDMLVCSDIMARGIDINCVKYVVSYDAPKHIRSYIHRVGRTGRGGIKGTAVTIVSSAQSPGFLRMLSDVKKDNVKQMAMSEESFDTFKPEYKIALQKLKQVLKTEKDKEKQYVKLEKKGLASIRRKKRKMKKKLKNNIAK